LEPDKVNVPVRRERDHHDHRRTEIPSLPSSSPIRGAIVDIGEVVFAGDARRVRESAELRPTISPLNLVIR
jgi:hypothetical protein